MRKSVLAMAAVAAMGVVGSANADFFSIRDASYINGPSTVLGNFVMNANTTASIGTDFDTEVTALGSGVRGLSSTAVGDIFGSIGTNLGLTYFGAWSGSQGFFGIAFTNGGVDRDFALTMSNANLATLGVFVDRSGTGSFVGGISGGGTYSSGTITLAANETFVAIFAGIGVNSEIGGGQVSDTNFAIRYLDGSAGTWSNIHSIASASSSSLNYATYSIPVPAPMLLAGAGLIGAAALRRRMVKKA